MGGGFLAGVIRMQTTCIANGNLTLTIMAHAGKCVSMTNDASPLLRRRADTQFAFVTGHIV